ncbi:MAG: alpha/beta fold hydrolase [bacterium]
MEPQSRLFDLTLSPLTLEAGAELPRHEVRGWWWGPGQDLGWLESRARLLSEQESAAAGTVVQRGDHTAPPPAPSTPGPVPDVDVPTVLVVHALTGDMRAGGPGGWWAPLIGPGRALDPRRHRVLCFNNLGSCYGTTGPADVDFPARSQDTRFPPTQVTGQGAFRLDESLLPATLTTWDQARSLLLALDALGIRQVRLVTGGSIGAMIVLCLAALDPERFECVMPIAGAEAASPWILGWSHVGRQAILADPGFPERIGRGLELARQIAHLTYRAEPGLMLRQGRAQAPDGCSERAGWTSRAPYRAQTYLEHHGRKLRARFDGRAYLAQMDAMDHHDLARPPAPPAPAETWPAELEGGPRACGAVPAGGGLATPKDPADSWGLRRIRASVLALSIDTDQLFFPAHMAQLCQRLSALGVPARHVQLHSPHGHDSFLIEWDQVAAALETAVDR